MTVYQHIEKYIVSPKAEQATASLKSILQNRKEENRERRQRLVHRLSTKIAEGQFFALGQTVEIKASGPDKVLEELINYLVINTYSKLPYLKTRQADPIAEIKALPNSDDASKSGLSLNGADGNGLAIQELRDYLQLAASRLRVLLADVVNRFAGIAWGWKPEWETVLPVARLFMAGEIKLMMDGSDLDPASAIEPLTKSARFKQVSILKRKVADTHALKRARELYKDLFLKLGREEDALVADYRTQLADWQSDLKSYCLAAALSHHPGKAAIDSILARLGQQLAIRDNFAFMEALLGAKDDWLDAAEDLHNLVNFYKTQIAAWRKLLVALAQILYLQGQGRDAMDDAMDDAMAIIENAAVIKTRTDVASPGDAAKPVTTNRPNAPAPWPKPPGSSVPPICPARLTLRLKPMWTLKWPGSKPNWWPPSMPGISPAFNRVDCAA